MASHHSEEEIREADKRSKDLLDSFTSEAIEDIQRERNDLPPKRSSLGRPNQPSVDQHKKNLVDLVNLENHNDSHSKGGRTDTGEYVPGDREEQQDSPDEQDIEYDYGREGEHEEDKDEEYEHDLRQEDDNNYMKLVKDQPESFGSQPNRGSGLFGRGIEEDDGNEYIDKPTPDSRGQRGGMSQIPNSGQVSSNRGQRKSYL